MPSIKSYSLVEQETIIRWDRTDEPAQLYTASPQEAQRWRKLGITVIPVGARAWQAQVPKKAVRLRRLVDGVLPRRPRPVGWALEAKRRQSSAVVPSLSEKE